MAVKKIRTVCKYCGGTEFVRGKVWNKIIRGGDALTLDNMVVCAQICKHCGTILREYIVNPENLPEY